MLDKIKNNPIIFLITICGMIISYTVGVTTWFYERDKDNLNSKNQALIEQKNLEIIKLKENNCGDITREKDKEIIKLKEKITELNNKFKVLSKSKDNSEKVISSYEHNEIQIISCAISNYTNTIERNLKCKTNKTLKCGTNEISANSLQSITCDNDSIIVTPQGKSEIQCLKQDFEGLFEPRIQELCNTIRSIEFDTTN